MKNYSRKWITQRVTAALLLPLTFWFIYSAISLSEMEYDDIMIFFKSYINYGLFACNANPERHLIINQQATDFEHLHIC